MRGSSTQIGERTLFSYEYSFLSVSRVQSADGLTEMQAYVKKYYTSEGGRGHLRIETEHSLAVNGQVPSDYVIEVTYQDPSLYL